MPRITNFQELKKMCLTLTPKSYVFDSKPVNILLWKLFHILKTVQQIMILLHNYRKLPKINHDYRNQYRIFNSLVFIILK